MPINVIEATESVGLQVVELTPHMLDMIRILGAVAREEPDKDLLTPQIVRELEAASLGLDRYQAAADHFKSPVTVANQKKMAIEKLGARNMPHAVTLAIELGLIELDSTGTTTNPLGEKERLELQHISFGLSATESAKMRNVALNTVQNQRRRVLEKLGATNSPHAVRIGFETKHLQSRLVGHQLYTN